MNFREKNPALLVVDVQQGFDEEAYWGGNRNNPDAEERIGQLLATWRTLELPVFHIRHASTNPVSRLHPSHPGFAFHERAMPQAGEPVITKSVNSGFIGTDLAEQLDARGLKTLIIVGMTTNHCISTTARMAANLGYDTYLISDATATFDRVGINGQRFDAELVHQVTLASLQEEFATVLDQERLLGLL